MFSIFKSTPKLDNTSQVMDLIKVSKNSILNKLFDVTEQQLREKLSGDELTEALKQLPSDDEKEFMKRFRSNAPELDRWKRKNSVCLNAEVTELDENKFSYLFNGKTFSVSSPTNCFAVSRKLETGRHDAVLEMNKQDCILVNQQKADFESLELDELNLLVNCIDRFFFQIYL